MARERRHGQPGVDPAAERPAHYPPRPGVEHDREIDEACGDGDMGDVGTLGDLPVYGMALARVPWPLQVVVGGKGVRMSNVISLAGARRRAGVPSIVEEAQQMIDLNGRRAGLIAAVIAKTPDTPDEERAYWVALAEEIARIEGYCWYVPDVDEQRVVDRRAPGCLPGHKEEGASDELTAAAPAAADAAPSGHSQ
jgi:hypothetical protein